MPITITLQERGDHVAVGVRKKTAAPATPAETWVANVLITAATGTFANGRRVVVSGDIEPRTHKEPA